jgi:hypothetical protein
MARKPKDITFVAQDLINNKIVLIQWRTLQVKTDDAWEEARANHPQLQSEHSWDEQYSLVGTIRGKQAWIGTFIRIPTKEDFVDAGKQAISE